MTTFYKLNKTEHGGAVIQDVCIAGNPAINGHCGHNGCVCSTGHPPGCNCRDCAMRKAIDYADRALKNIALRDPEEAGYYARLCFRFSRTAKEKEIKFAAVGQAVMHGRERIATAVSNSFAKRIASALNMYKSTQGGH